MKKAFCCIFISLTIFLFGCMPRVSTTDKSENYDYKIGETINIVSNQDGKSLGTLVITKVEVLSSDSFDAKVSDGYDSQGNPQYKTVKYNQLIQVFYKYEAPDAIIYKNFLIIDASSETATDINYINPKPNYKEKTNGNDKSFVVGLKNKSNHIEIDFRYRSFDALPTAVIKTKI